jgi:hypothetical protein
VRLSDGPLRTQDHDGARVCVDGRWIIFSRGERSLALGPDNFYRRFSLDARQPSGYGGKHAGARLGHGAGSCARAVLRFLALDRRDRRLSQPGAVRLGRRAYGLRGFIRDDRFVLARDCDATGFFGKGNGYPLSCASESASIGSMGHCPVSIVAVVKG